MKSLRLRVAPTVGAIVLVGLALGLTSWLAHAGADVWWLLPLSVAALLAASLWRETRGQR
jgi:hypothetical protein